MARTDGYITDSSSGDWQFSNTGGAGRGDSINPEGAAWARVERVEGGIAGTKCDANGAISEGPTISFTTPDGLLSGAAEADGDRPWVVWAGVSPMSLQEILVVFNKPVVLLNKSKISGGDVVALTGRLLVIAMEEPISINGKQQVNVTIGAGAVGFYTEPDEGGEGEGEGDGEGEEESGEEPSLCPEPAPKTASEKEGELPELEPYEPPCDCTEFEEGDSGAGEDSGPPGAELADALVFADICNAEAQCGEFQGDKASFAVNNTLVFPVRCTHPFVLVKLKICGCPTCTDDAKVWMACMEVFGSTLPLEILPLDKLYDIDPCNVLDKYTDGFPARLQGGAGCCSQASVVIAASAGLDVVVSDGLWEGKVPGLPGQPVLYKAACQEDCQETPCSPSVVPDFEDYYVAEDIIKPSQRELPVSFFDSWLVTMTTITIPTSTTTFEFTFPISQSTTTVAVMTAWAGNDFSLPTYIKTQVLTYNDFVQDEYPLSVISNLVTLVSEVVPVVTALDLEGIVLTDYTSNPTFVATSAAMGTLSAVTAIPPGAKWVVGVGTADIVYCDQDGNEQTVNVITSLNTVDAFLGSLIVATGVSGTLIQILESAGTTVHYLYTSMSGNFVNITALKASPDPGTALVVPNGFTTETITANKSIGGTVVTLPVEVAMAVVPIVTWVTGDEALLTLEAEFSDVTVTWPTDSTTAEVLKADPEGGITLLTEASEPACDVKYKFLNHPGEDKVAKATGRVSIPRDCCEGIDEFCITYEADVDWEEQCKNVKLLSAIYVDRGVQSTNAEKCPCFDCKPELPQVDGENAYPTDVETLGTDINMPCTIRVQRVNRRWCITCRGSL